LGIIEYIDIKEKHNASALDELQIIKPAHENESDQAIKNLMNE
jgi:hypothetical protein